MRGAGRDDAEIERKRPQALERYATHLGNTLRPEHVTPKPGIHGLLAALQAEPLVTLGLLTGNLAACARTKLLPLGIADLFGVGAFGCDHEDRYLRPALAVERAYGATGCRFQGPQVVIVGDSVHDVLCGRSLGVRAVAVATGRTPLPALRAQHPAAALTDLSDTRQAVEAILG